MKKTLLIIMTTLFIGASCNNVDEDLDLLCNLSDKIMKDTTVTIEQKNMVFIKEVQGLKLSTEVQKFLHDISIASEVTYKDFEAFAQKNNIKDWHCESLKDLLK